jgi:hypothetical protein
VSLFGTFLFAEVNVGLNTKIFKKSRGGAWGWDKPFFKLRRENTFILELSCLRSFPSNACTVLTKLFGKATSERWVIPAYGKWPLLEDGWRFALGDKVGYYISDWAFIWLSNSHQIIIISAAWWKRK